MLRFKTSRQRLPIWIGLGMLAVFAVQCRLTEQLVAINSRMLLIFRYQMAVDDMSTHLRRLDWVSRSTVADQAERQELGVQLIGDFLLARRKIYPNNYSEAGVPRAAFDRLESTVDLLFAEVNKRITGGDKSISVSTRVHEANLLKSAHILQESLEDDGSDQTVLNAQVWKSLVYSLYAQGLLMVLNVVFAAWEPKGKKEQSTE